MIEAPFTAGEAEIVLSLLGGIFLTIAGLMVMLRAGRAFIGRSLALGVLASFLAGLSKHIFL